MRGIGDRGSARKGPLLLRIGTAARHELERFFEDQEKMRDDIKVAVRQTIERIAANVRFVERNSG